MAKYPIADLGSRYNVRVFHHAIMAMRVDARKPLFEEPNMDEIRVLLYGLTDNCGLIIPHPTGIVYQNQVAGMMCRQKLLEGIFVPVDWDDAANAMEECFVGGDGLSPEDADRIDEKLAERGTKVNRARLHDSCEAWVWLSLGDGVRLVSGITPTEAVLIWKNSD